MDNTTRPVIIFEGGHFYSATPAGRRELTDSGLDELKSGYVLVLSDSVLFYTTMEFPDAPKRKLNLFISNYLQGSFPAQLCERFCYISKGDRVLIGVFSAEFSEHLEQYTKIFEKAAYITSPLAGAYHDTDSFDYEVNGAAIRIEDGLISNVESVQYPLQPSLSPNPDAKLTVPFIKGGTSALDQWKIPAAVLVACYLLFAAGGWFRLQSASGKLHKAEAKLAEIYKKAGVSDSRDPYGMLLAKAGGNEHGERFSTLFVLENLSKAANDNIKADSLEIKGNNVTIQGSSADYSFLEQYKKALSQQTGKDVQLIDTVKKDNAISFTLRFDI